MTDAATEAATPNSLYDRLGGVYGIAQAVDVLTARLYVNGAVNANPVTAQFHGLGGQAGFKFLVTAWSIEQTGGPKVYAWRDMREAHAHINVSEREFDIVATEIKTSLYHVNCPDQEMNEFLAIIESYRSEVVAPAVPMAAE